MGDKGGESHRCGILHLPSVPKTNFKSLQKLFLDSCSGFTGLHVGYGKIKEDVSVVLHSDFLEDLNEF